jgi:hypothetical protein
MIYETFMENYCPELQLIDALDEIKNYSLEAAETIDLWVSHSTSEKIDEESPQMDQIL